MSSNAISAGFTANLTAIIGVKAAVDGQNGGTSPLAKNTTLANDLLASLFRPKESPKGQAQDAISDLLKALQDPSTQGSPADDGQIGEAIGELQKLLGGADGGPLGGADDNPLGGAGGNPFSFGGGHGPVVHESPLGQAIHKLKEAMKSCFSEAGEQAEQGNDAEAGKALQQGMGLGQILGKLEGVQANQQGGLGGLGPIAMQMPIATAG